METDTTEGPRERLARLGATALSDAELVALLLGTGARGEPVGRLAERVLTDAGGLDGISQRGVGALAVARGVGEARAARIVAALELGRRGASRPLKRGVRIESSRDVDLALRPRLADATAEQFLAIPLDAKNRPMGELRIAQGGLVACQVSPSDVFRALVREAAAGVVFVHNHPSGEPDPSSEDILFTDRLSRAGDLLGVRVVDHVIIAHAGYFSFVDAGILRRVEEAA